MRPARGEKREKREREREEDVDVQNRLTCIEKRRCNYGGRLFPTNSLLSKLSVFTLYSSFLFFLFFFFLDGKIWLVRDFSSWLFERENETEGEHGVFNSGNFVVFPLYACRLHTIRVSLFSLHFLFFCSSYTRWWIKNIVIYTTRLHSL